ncbi:MAG: hypothetical protein IID41_04015 [Planctomycetes bacterium]|nr:hypothetical protein [Planctomycetota bacterium]MCH8963559.1 hypothetical protein [Planctomycetota bacterium]
MATEIRYYRIGVVALSLQSCSTECVRMFDRLYDSYRTEDSCETAFDITVVRRKAKPWSAAEYVVECNGETYVVGRDERGVMPQLESVLNHQTMLTQNAFFQLHAGVMSYKNRAVVFTGKSGTGKSTLAAALLARGWSYLCDEFALIEPKTLLVYPFPKALSIKQAGREHVERLNLPLIKGEWSDGKRTRPFSYVAPAEAGGEVGGPCPIGSVLFLSRRGNMPLRWSRLTAPEAAMTLYRCGLNTENLGRQAFDTAVALARQAQCFEFNLGSVEESCDALESLVAEQEIGKTRQQVA